MPVDAGFLEQLKELQLITRKKVSSAYSGGRASITYGRGIEPVDHREYFPGDDFRLIDWKVYSRTEKLYIRRFEEERDLTLHILVDASSSMDFAHRGMRKFDYAGSLAVAFEFVQINANEKFAHALFSERLRDVLAPNKGKHHLFKAIQLINHATLSGSTRMDVCAAQYTKMIKTKSYIVVLSDFMEPLDALENGLYRMAKHSKEMAIVQVLDPSEIELAWGDDVKFEDIETGAADTTYLSPHFKRNYHSKVEEHNAAVQGICEDIGADFHQVTTDQQLLSAFIGIMGGGTHHG
ncbi:Uncharacterised protein [uncultured archaeon]|nr:Uncharacterised protein [uncultured archaeon]